MYSMLPLRVSRAANFTCTKYVCLCIHYMYSSSIHYHYSCPHLPQSLSLVIVIVVGAIAIARLPPRSPHVCRNFNSFVLLNFIMKCTCDVRACVYACDYVSLGSVESK